MKRNFAKTITERPTPFKEVAVDFRESMRARAHLANTFPLFERKLAFEQARQLPPGSLIIRVEAAYDPEFARENKQSDNISRRYICVAKPVDSGKHNLRLRGILTRHTGSDAACLSRPWLVPARLGLRQGRNPR